MIDIHHPHDSLFKYIFSNVDNLKTFFKHFIPDIYKSMDLDTLQLINTERQAENIKKFFLDLAFSCKVKGVDSNIYIVFEHKSYPDKLAPIQIMYYCASVWEQNIREKKDFTPIIPLVIAHYQNCVYIILDYTVAITKKPEIIENIILESGG